MSINKKRVEDLQFDANQAVNENGGVVIGHLSGPVADIVNTTRNGRKYSEELWDKVFKDPITQEYFNCGGIFGELGHPIDREETDMEKIAICMPKAPEKKNGKLWATFDILDTPNGRILKTLCQYGYKMGISSRGSGDLVTDYDGQESVDPDTYQFNAFDAVLLPAVKEARLNFTESLHSNKSFKKALTESLNAATSDEKKIMEETLNNLNINLTEDFEEGYVVYIPISEIGRWSSEIIPQDIQDHGIVIKKCGEDFVDFDRLLPILDNNCRYPTQDCCPVDGDCLLVSCLNPADNLEESVSLDETRSSRTRLDIEDDSGNIVVRGIDNLNKARDYVADHPSDNYKIVYKTFFDGIEDERVIIECKESKHTVRHRTDDIEESASEVDNNESIINDLQEALKAKVELENTVVELQEKLSVCYAKETSLNESLATTKSNMSKLAEDAKRVDALSTKVSRLSEELEEKNKKLETTVSNRRSLQERLTSNVKEMGLLKEQLSELKKENVELKRENSSLSESVGNLQKDIELKKSEYSKKLNESNLTAEKQKKIANKAVDKYIDSQATRIGVSSNEIKNKLPESYTFDDIDKICEDLQSYQLNMSKLPFNTSIRENLKMKATSSQNEYIKPANAFADDVDNDLLQLAGL